MRWYHCLLFLFLVIATEINRKRYNVNINFKLTMSVLNTSYLVPTAWRELENYYTALTAYFRVCYSIIIQIYRFKISTWSCSYSMLFNFNSCLQWSGSMCNDWKICPAPYSPSISGCEFWSTVCSSKLFQDDQNERG